MKDKPDQTDPEYPTANDDGKSEAARESRLSRRRFTKAVSLSAAGLALGTGATATATAAEETCTSLDTIAVGDGNFSVKNNQWSTTAVEQCIQKYDDDSYGWTWNRGSTDASTPNYPQTLIGTKPWGSNTNSLQFPIQRSDVDQLEFVLAIDQTISGSKWNLAEEWWLTSQKPGGDVSSAIEHEVMLVLDWGSGLRQGGVIESDAVTDKYGNSIDYWSNYQIGWNFHIFRIAAQEVPDAVDLTAIIEYMSENIDSVSPDHWITGIELGNEYWDETSGSTRITQFDVTLNGETATSGPGSTRDTTAPAAPGNLTSPSQTSSTVELAWDSASDSGGSGLSHYAVFVDGTQSQQVSAGTTQTTIAELSADTSYEFGVTAVDNAGNSSAQASLTERTEPETVEQQPFDGPHTIPGRLQAENFDTGGEGVAYHDTGSGNNGVDYRDTNVDIGGSSEGGYNIGWIEPGEWWEYTIEVEQDERYKVTARVASAMGGGAFHVDVDGETVTDSIGVPETGGWADWTTVSETGISLSRGQHVIRVVAEADTWNLDWIEFTTSADNGGDTNGVVLTDYSSYPDRNEFDNWSGANSFQNGGGDLVDGALRLEYDNAGWYGEQVGRDISSYTDMVFRIKGTTGGEEYDFTVELGGETKLFADVVDDSISTEFSELRFDIEAAGVDRTNPGQLNLNFWQGNSGTVSIDEIRFE